MLNTADSTRTLKMATKIVDIKAFREIEKRCKVENRKVSEILSKCIDDGFCIDNGIKSAVIKAFKNDGIQAVPITFRSLTRKTE